MAKTSEEKAKEKAEKEKTKAKQTKPAPVKLLVLLDGVQYTGEEARNGVESLLERFGYNYKEVKLLRTKKEDE